MPIDHGVGVAHRRRVGALAAIVIGGVLVAIIGELLVQARENLVEVVGVGIERQHERTDFRPQEMVRAGRAERREIAERVRIDEFQHFGRIREMPDLALVR
jgi:hypothetical protein